MIQSALAGDPVLVRLTEAIVARVRPRRIVLFGSRARGDARPDSDYDVMVEEDQESENERTRASEITDAIRLSVDVQITLRTPAQFESRRDDVGTIDYDIAREGIVLYVDPAISGIAQLRPATRVREQPETPPESLAEWIEAANEDLWALETLVPADNVRWRVVAFHCQQAAEKYMKAVLVNRHVKPPRTHDLEDLLTALTKAGYPTEGLSAACKHLTDYAVDARYPKMRVNEAEGRRAVADCRRVVEEAKRWIG